MPVSKHRKDHKKKVNVYKKNVQIARDKLKEQMMREYMEKVQSNQEQKRQESGEMITNDEINVDLDVDLDLDNPTSDIPVQEVTPVEIVEPISESNKSEESK